MKKPNPVKLSDLSRAANERISIEFGQLNSKGRSRHFVSLDKGSALSAKRCRYIAAWLQRAASFIDAKALKPEL